MPANLPKLFIDTLAITLPVSAERCRQVQQRLDNRDRWYDDLHACDHRKGVYEYRYLLHVAGGEIDIFSSPQKEGRNFLKIEYSPNKIGIEGGEALASFLLYLIGDNFREAFYSATPSRLHIAFDIKRVLLSELWIEDGQEKPSSIIRGPTERIETIYLGYNTKRQLCVYDKRKQLEDTGKIIPTTRTKPPIVRFEYRDEKPDYTLNGFRSGARGNVFNRFVVRTFLPHPETGYAQSRVIFDACRLHGKANVLAAAEGAERESVERVISNFPIAKFWQRRTSLWGQLKRCVDDLLPPVAL